MNLCRQSRPRKLAVLKSLPLDLITVHFQTEQVPDALGDQATGLFQHLRMAFLLHSRDSLHQMLRN